MWGDLITIAIHSLVFFLNHCQFKPKGIHGKKIIMDRRMFDVIITVYSISRKTFVSLRSKKENVYHGECITSKNKKK